MVYSIYKEKKLKEKSLQSNKLWAPWRMKYIRSINTKGCVFCKIFKESKDKKNYILLRSKHCFAVLNTFPYNNGHTLIVTNKHLASLEALNDDELLDLNKVLITVKQALKKTLKPLGFNIGFNIGEVAGAGIKNHLHMHIVPRWPGDTNFMSTISDTRVISQSLAQLSQHLQKKLPKRTS
jgi:ATP adenylyltransferase